MTPFANLPGGTLGSEPIDVPVVNYGPFVMDTEDDIRQVIEDYRSRRMGHIGS